VTRSLTIDSRPPSVTYAAPASRRASHDSCVVASGCSMAGTLPRADATTASEARTLPAVRVLRWALRFAAIYVWSWEIAVTWVWLGSDLAVAIPSSEGIPPGMGILQLPTGQRLPEGVAHCNPPGSGYANYWHGCDAANTQRVHIAVSIFVVCTAATIAALLLSWLPFRTRSGHRPRGAVVHDTVARDSGRHQAVRRLTPARSSRTL
jgi:hypothetical protein